MFAAPIPVVGVKKNSDGVTLQMKPGVMRLEVYSPRIIRVTYAAQDKLPDLTSLAVIAKPQVTKWTWRETKDEVILRTDEVQARVNRTTGTVAFYDASGRRLLAEPAAGGKTMTSATVNGESSYQPEQTFSSPADEFLYGLGQFQDGIWNWRGMPEQLRQLNTQIAIPMIVSSYGYGLLWNNASLTDFNPVDTQVALTNRSGTYTTGAAGDYVFMVKDGDRRNLIGIQVNGQTIAAITNMWVTYTISGKIALPAHATCSVTLLGGGRDAKIFARPLGDTTTFRSEVGDAIDYYFFYGPTADEIIAGYRQATGHAPLFPKAAYGFWQCRERYSSQAQMLDAARRFRAGHIPVDFIVQDWQYWGQPRLGRVSMGFEPLSRSHEHDRRTPHQSFQIHDFGVVQSPGHRWSRAGVHAARVDSGIAMDGRF